MEAAVRLQIGGREGRGEKKWLNAKSWLSEKRRKWNDYGDVYEGWKRETDEWQKEEWKGKNVELRERRANVIFPTKQSKDAGGAENEKKRSEIQAFSWDGARDRRLRSEDSSQWFLSSNLQSPIQPLWNAATRVMWVWPGAYVGSRPFWSSFKSLKITRGELEDGASRSCLRSRKHVVAGKVKHHFGHRLLVSPPEQGSRVCQR